MRAGLLLGAVVLSAMLSGCSAYNAVSQGRGGATSPAESGQQGAYANQDATYTDPAGQGPYPLVKETDAVKAAGQPADAAKPAEKQEAKP